MNFFYVLYCIRSVLAESSTHAVAPITPGATVQRETKRLEADIIDARDSIQEATSSSAAISDAHYSRYGRGTLCLAMALWIWFTVQTYSAGYHTPRHMIYGAGAGMMTLLIFDDLSGWASLWLSSLSCEGGRRGDARSYGSRQLAGGASVHVS
eukprot:COSAG02_NODE_338_length_24206_cov_94.612685_9_plen_153_part_00